MFLNNHEEKRKLMFINISRAYFCVLLVFELLNVLKIIRLNLQFTWIGLLITGIFVFVLTEYIGYKFKKRKGHLMHWSIWAVAAASLSLDAAGDFFFLYGKLEWWDQFVHYFICASTCFFLYAIYNAFWIDKFSYSLLFKAGRLRLSLVLSATTTLALAALYEIEEYTEDMLFHTHRLGDGYDTANDLFLGLMGILTTSALLYIYFIATKRREIIK
jgi:hypothetical protein